MKILGYPQTALVLLLCCCSCVGAKKYKALEAQNEKIATTLRATKEELSAAKRNLNKLVDRSSSNQEELDASIGQLQINLQNSQAQLNASKKQLESLQQTNKQEQQKLQDQNTRYQKQLQPYKAAKTVLQQEQKNLALLQRTIEALLEQDSTAKITTQLLPARLVVTFEQGYLFGSSERSISSTGREKLEALATIIQQYPEIHLDILGHMAASNDALGTWKTSTRQPLVVLYALLKAGAKSKYTRLIAHSQYAPLIAGNSKEAAAKNARTELVFHYNGARFVPSLVNP
ncbi:MAG: hypothetical protein ACRBFS_08610 [Aureispira sp.]